MRGDSVAGHKSCTWNILVKHKSGCVILLGCGAFCPIGEVQTHCGHGVVSANLSPLYFLLILNFFSSQTTQCFLFFKSYMSCPSSFLPTFLCITLGISSFLDSLPWKSQGWAPFLCAPVVLYFVLKYRLLCRSTLSIYVCPAGLWTSGEHGQWLSPPLGNLPGT